EAQNAAEAIAVDYEVLPSVVDPLEATKPGAPAVWPEAPDNIVAAMSYGDAAKVEAAFASATHEVSLDLVSQRLAPSAMDPRSTPRAACWPIACARSAAPALTVPARPMSSRWCSGRSCRPVSTICRWCISKSNP